MKMPLQLRQVTKKLQKRKNKSYEGGWRPVIRAPLYHEDTKRYHVVFLHALNPHNLGLLNGLFRKPESAQPADEICRQSTEH